MTLAQTQRAFIAEIAADDIQSCSSLGMEIYRSAYRGRLAAALEASFEKTRSWVGEDAFRIAAAHYILSSPSTSWTLDAYGAGFPDLLAQLFAEDGEVAELAWLEWHMQQAFGAPDHAELTPDKLIAAGLAAQDWDQLRFTMAAGFAAREVHHECAALWHALESEAAKGAAIAAIEPAVLVVWRCGLSPHFRLFDCAEFAALNQLAAGAAFGEVAAQAGEQGIASLGQWFAQWLGEGLFSATQRG